MRPVSALVVHEWGESDSGTYNRGSIREIALVPYIATTIVVPDQDRVHS